MAITLTVPAIKDFQVCELFYQYRHLEQVPEAISGRDILYDRFENTIKRVVSFFFYKKQGGVTPSYSALLNRWEKLWFPKDMTAYDMTIERHEIALRGNMVSYSNLAAAALLKFHESFEEEDRLPLLIDERFLIPLKKDIRLDGVFDLILRGKDSFEVIKWLGKQRRPSLEHFKFDFAALRFAFEYRNEAIKTVSYGLYDLASTNPGLTTYAPNLADVSELKYWAEKMYKAKVYVPRRGYTVYCKTCVFDNPCSKWEMPHGTHSNEQ